MRSPILCCLVCAMQLVFADNRLKSYSKVQRHFAFPSICQRIDGLQAFQPNQYGIPFPKRQETAAPPSPELRQAPPPAATTPTQVATHTNPPPSTKSGTAPSPTPATIMECVAVCYRRINAQEFGQLKQAYPDAAVLRKKLARLNDNGGVAPDMNLGFFLRVLTEFA